MTARTVERTTRKHSRQRGLASESFDRTMDIRERRSSRHGASTPFSFGYSIGERSEIERRSLLDVCAPSRS